MKKTPLLIIKSIVYSFFTSFILSHTALANNIEVIEISSEPYIKVIKRTGRLDFQRTLNLSFKTSGYLSKIDVNEGDSFVKGQILAELDAFELIAEKNSSYARLSQAKKDVARINALLSKKLSSQQALDNAKTIVETTRSDHKVAQYNLEKSQLIAPFDGVVLTRVSELSELQSPTKLVMTLAAMNENLVVRVALTSEEIYSIKLNQQVQVSLSKATLMGTVSKIPVTNNAVSQLYTIEIFLTDMKSKTVTVGQQANVIISNETDNYVYRLPISALNGVDRQGKALITTQLAGMKNKQKYLQKRFDIKQLSNDYIYLSTQQGALPLNVVTRGWQQLKKQNENLIKHTKSTINKSVELDK